MPRSFPLHIHLLGLALGLILLVGGLLSGIGQHMTSQMMENVAEDLALRIDRELHGSLLERVQPADMALRLLQTAAPIWCKASSMACQNRRSGICSSTPTCRYSRLVSNPITPISLTPVSATGTATPTAAASCW